VRNKIDSSRPTKYVCAGEFMGNNFVTYEKL